MPHVCGDEPYHRENCSYLRRMPHVCGDEPGQSLKMMSWSVVCPTYVGMNRNRV